MDVPSLSLQLLMCGPAIILSGAGVLHGPPCIIIQHIPHIITGKKEEKREKNGKEQSSTGLMWSLSAHRVNTTQQVYHTMQLLSRASVPRKALPSFGTEHTYISVLHKIFELELHRRHKGTCLHVARDCTIT